MGLRKDLENEYKKYSKLLRESYIFDDRDEDFIEGDENSDEDFDDMESIRATGLESESDKIAQIRDLALDGVREYSQDITSPQYDFYKKIWQLCDKAVLDTTKGNSNKEHNSED